MINLYYDCCGKECDLLKTDNIYKYFQVINMDIIQLKKYLKQCPECARKEVIEFYGLDKLGLVK